VLLLTGCQIDTSEQKQNELFSTYCQKNEKKECVYSISFNQLTANVDFFNDKNVAFVGYVSNDEEFGVSLYENDLVASLLIRAC